MRRIWVTGLALAGVVGATIAVIGAQRGAGGGDPVLVGYNGFDWRGDDRVIGLTAGGRALVSFRGGEPDRVRGIGAVSGLLGDNRLIGIDFRVQDGRLYGVGDKGGVYTLSPQNAKAAKVSQLSVALSGQDFDIDFNPAANRLRVVSDTGQNLRHNIDDPAGAPAAGMTATDTALTTPPTAGTTAGVTGAAYTNNDVDADTATTLFDLNPTTDQTVVQSPANQGTLAPTGRLAVDASGDAGFDIRSSLRNGASAANTAMAVLKVDGRYRLYRVDLLTGRATHAGAFPRDNQVTDIAIPLDS